MKEMDPSQEASPLNHFYNSRRIRGQVHSAIQATLRKHIIDKLRVFLTAHLKAKSALH